MKTLTVTIMLMMLTVFVRSQSLNHVTEGTAEGKKGSGMLIDVIGYTLFLINPDVIVESKKVHFGLTKELSAGIYPLGRAEFEYTYVFRSERKSNFRLSYNFDIPVSGIGQTGGFFISPGGGYYTDLERKGWFAQISAGLIGAPFAGKLRVHPNLKLRKTFVQDLYPDIFDVSLGVGLCLYY